MAKRSSKQRRLVGYPAFIAERPPDVQIVHGKVMRADWSDPDDTTPNATKTARQVSAHRAFCPLRWCIRRHGERSHYTSDHIEAADRLRLAWDGSRLGFSSLRDWRPVNSLNYRPSTGPTRTAQRQLKCRIAFDAMWAMFNTQERALIVAVLLKNIAIGNAAELFEWTKPNTTEMLVSILDKLCERLGIGERRKQAAA
jgi:hypothetical protein